MDVTDSAGVGALLAEHEERSDGADIGVTNSGGPPSKCFSGTMPEEWRAAVDKLLMSAVFFGRETSHHMQKKKLGRLTTIASSGVQRSLL
jgi:3-oxoacyl-[acyl-carrier protein] reductase